MPEPLVSILTPSLNQAQFVEACIRSIRRQDYPRIEQIVVDGGSTDGTLEILRRYGDESLQLVLLPGSTQAEALNAALGHARGEIVGWLNTDDAYFGTDAVSTAVRAFAADPGCVAVYGDGVIADERGLILRHISTSDRRLARLEAVSPLVQPAVFFRRGAVEERFLREDLRVRIDYELWLRLRRAGRFRKVDRILAIDRDYPARTTRIHEEQGARENLLLADWYRLRPPGRAPVRIASRWARRARGLPALLNVERDYRLAFDAEIDSRTRRLVRQLLLPQRSLHAV